MEPDIEDMIFVCQVCKGNHETNNENCPGYNANQQAICFKGHKCIMSNMYPCTVHYKDKIFGSSEHAYQWEKAMAVGALGIAEEIENAQDGYSAKSKAEGLDQGLVKRWRATQAVSVMKKITKAKFDSVEEFRKEVLDSKGMYIIEATTDTFWGVGFLPEIAIFCRPQYWPGQNVMGRIIMELRDTFLGIEEPILPYEEIGKLVRSEVSLDQPDPLDVDDVHQ